MNWSDFIKGDETDSERYFIRVQHNPKVGKETKTKKSRKIPVASPLKDELLKIKSLRKPKKNDPIFLMESGIRANHHLYRHLIDCLVRNDIYADSEMTTHSFRHIPHSCYDFAFRRNSDIGIGEFLDKKDDRHEMDIGIEIGETVECKKCGRSFYFDVIPPEIMFQLYRDRFCFQ